jgi:superfamily II DNA or RNA helicase/very-short-patch-repair endonuclease
VTPFADHLPADSYLEHAFLRWVLGPAARFGLAVHLRPQHRVAVGEHEYRLDYLIEGGRLRIAVELDGYAFHSDRPAFTHDRLRQNDLAAAGYTVLRFSYDAVRTDTARCVRQLQALLRQDPRLAPFVVESPDVPTPVMEPSPLVGGPHAPPPPRSAPGGPPQTYFDGARGTLRLDPLRQCQREALFALANYYGSGGTRAACVMSVGAGKTVLGVAAALAFARRRALVVTPGSVIRGTFARALDPEALGNALYGLPSGPLLPGLTPPRTLVLDGSDGPLRDVPAADLDAADVIVTNFHALGTADDGLLAKLGPDAVDVIVVDEAHIAAADSYQRLFAHFPRARTLLMSACFQRLDGRPIEADVVYRYRLTDAVADGHAKRVRAVRFEPDPIATTYEVVWPSGGREEIVGREALLEAIRDPRKVARITAKSGASIHHVMRAVRRALDEQAERLAPVKPRVLFSALGEEHEAQIARIARQHGVPTAYLHHSMGESEIAGLRARFENDSGDLEGLVQLRMLGQGYDFPPISVVVPLRPYGSYGEFYQFVGRGVRRVRHPDVAADQVLDVVYHAELGLDDHLATLQAENDLDPIPVTTVEPVPVQEGAGRAGEGGGGPAVEVTAEVGQVHAHVVHDRDRVERRRSERRTEALAQQYARYAAANADPVPFETFVAIVQKLSQ